MAAQSLWNRRGKEEYDEKDENSLDESKVDKGGVVSLLYDIWRFYNEFTKSHPLYTGVALQVI